MRQIRHAHDPAIDPDVPLYTDVTPPGVTPELLDAEGRRYALITLYNIDPPLEDLPSKEAGVDRGMDYRDPSNIVKAAYSNYVSAVFTNDAERRPVAGHPIGHFYVKVEVPGQPTIMTGMTTIQRADEELVDVTLDRGLGIGGVLLTREPGRLNSSAEVMRELSLRQRQLVVVDGVNNRLEGGVNVGPEFLIEDGNVVFARSRVPLANAEDALEAFRGFVRRCAHNQFGSLLSRPHRGTGAGCSAFAMFGLKAAGVIPIIDEDGIDPYLTAEPLPFWANYYNRLHFPWAHIGCDERVGLTGDPQPAAYTIYDELFHDLTTEEITAASAGLAAKIREDSGAVVGTLFEYGALTPLRDLFILAKRRDPFDSGDYTWAAPGEGLPVGFWDNSLFSDWVKGFWRRGAAPDPDQRLSLVREGRFLGVERDAMDAPRIKGDFFAKAAELAARREALAARGVVARTCQDVFLELALE